MMAATALAAEERADPLVTGPAVGRKVSGKLLEVSQIPDPGKAPYPDCLQIVELAVSPDSRAVDAVARPLPETILVAWLAFDDRKLLPVASLAEEADVSVRVIPFAEAPKEIRTMQRADTVENFVAPLYYALSVDILAQPAKARGNNGGNTAKRIVKSHGEWGARTKTLHSEAREAGIEAGRRRIGAALSAHGGDWDQWSNGLLPFYRELRSQSVPSEGGVRKGRYFFSRTYDHRFQELMKSPETSPALDMILAFDRALAERGIDLIVVPFPFKEEITADRFSPLAPKDGHLSPQRLRFVDWLLAHDVEVVDLAPALKQAADEGKAEWLYYDYGELHPARDGIEVAAGVLAERLERYDFPREWRGLKLRDTQFTMPESFRKRFPNMPKHAEYPARLVITPDGDILPKEAPDSPVLLAGDSFTRVPALYNVFGASLREHLAWQSGVLARDLGVAGSASKTMRNLLREGPEILEGCEVCIFVFAQYPLFVEEEDLDDPSYQWDIVPLP